MNLFDFELTNKDLDPLEDRLRSQLGKLPDVTRRAYYTEITPRLRDPDTYVVLCWSVGLLGLHHLYLGRWLAFVRDLIAGICVMVVLIFWLLHGEWAYSAWLFVVAVAVTLFDTLYSLIFSQRIVQKHNIMLGLTWLVQNGHSLEAGTSTDPLSPLIIGTIQQNDRRLGLLLTIGATLLIGIIWLFYAFALPMIAERITFVLPKESILIVDEQKADMAIDRMKSFSGSALPHAHHQGSRGVTPLVGSRGETPGTLIF
ncbi:MAG: hypothetical protein G8237_05360 [Magnetococcales bacterium]|nr:hypothetical protein [Magnetococcales bacterium]